MVELNGLKCIIDDVRFLQQKCKTHTIQLRTATFSLECMAFLNHSTNSKVVVTHVTQGLQITRNMKRNGRTTKARKCQDKLQDIDTAKANPACLLGYH